MKCLRRILLRLRNDRGVDFSLYRPSTIQRRLARRVVLNQLDQRLDDLKFRQEAAVSSRLRRRQLHIADLTAAVLRHDPRQQLGLARERLAACRTRLDRSLERTLHHSTARLSALDAQLHSLSPLAVLERGYALVLTAHGTLVRTTNQIAAGDQVTTRLSDGEFISRVESGGKKQEVRR